MKKQEIEWLLQEKYHGEKSEDFFADCRRLENGELLGYIIGHVPFLNCTIHLDSHPLIPRPETEYWVEQAILIMKAAGFKNSPKALDLCAGSGAIGVAIAKALPEICVTFGEIDAAHLPTIKKNITANVSINRNICGTVIESDLFENISGCFDYIFCNPPYIDVAANTVEKSVTDFEPHLALFGGKAGMELIAKIICDTPTHLTAGGQLWLEHEPSQVVAMHALAAQHGFTCVTHPDQYSSPRYSILTVAQ